MLKNNWNLLHIKYYQMQIAIILKYIYIYYHDASF